MSVPECSAMAPSVQNVPEPTQCGAGVQRAISAPSASPMPYRPGIEVQVARPGVHADAAALQAERRLAQVLEAELRHPDVHRLAAQVIAALGHAAALPARRGVARRRAIAA